MGVGPVYKNSVIFHYSLSGVMTRLWCLWLVSTLALEVTVTDQSRDKGQILVSHWTQLRSLQI